MRKALKPSTYLVATFAVLIIGVWPALAAA